jgi:hypothetical protein
MSNSVVSEGSQASPACLSNKSSVKKRRIRRIIRNIGGMLLTVGNRSTRRKIYPSVTFLLQISHGVARDRTWASVVRFQRLDACAMARLLKTKKVNVIFDPITL